WNGMPVDAREVTGWMLAQSEAYGTGGSTFAVGLGGTAHEPGKLVLRVGEDTHVGATPIERWNWNHLAVVQDADTCRVYLNGNSTPEITLPPTSPAAGELTFGGNGERDANWEGRLDEIAVFDRALTVEEIRRLAGASQ